MTLKLKQFEGWAAMCLILFALTLPGGLSAQDHPDLKRYLDKIDGSGKGELNRVKSESLSATFDQIRFYSLRFRRYPVAIQPPEPLGQNNVLALVGEKVSLLKSEEDLKKFFTDKLSPVKTAAEKKRVVESWLLLSKELQHDGFFEFTEPKIKIVNGEVQGELGVAAKRRDKGQLSVSCQFAGSGKLLEIESKSTLYRGIRPR